MFPPGYHQQQFTTTVLEQISPGNATTVMMVSTPYRFNPAASPSHSGCASSALPKFGQPFGERGAHMTEFNNPSSIPINSIPSDLQLQVSN